MVVKKIAHLLWPLAWALVANPALAGANFDGTVHAVVMDKVQIAAVDGVPEWLQAGQEVQAFGWTAQVQEVRADGVTLKLGLSKLKNVKLGDPVSIRAPAAQDPDPALCGV
jgi:hypothetical protein